MYFHVKLRLILITCVICALVELGECKRGGGGRRGGTYRGSSSVWSKSKQQGQSGANYDLYGSNRRGSKSQSEAPKPVVPKQEPPKASAPPAPKNQDAKSSSAFINQEKTHDVQQKPIGFEQANKNAQPNGQQRPIGWDVKQDAGLNKNPSGSISPTHVAGQQSYPSGSNPSHVAGQQSYPSSHGNPANPTGAINPTHVAGQQNYPPSHGNPSNPSGAINPTHVAGQQNYPTQVGNHPSYPAQPGTNYYGQQPQYGAPYNPGQQPQQQFPGYQYNPGMGPAPQMPNTGLYHNNMGYSPGMGQHPQYGGNNGKSGGLFGSLFGGNRHGGYGGYGGYGGFGGYGVGGYGKKYGGGFGMGFGKNAYRNAFFGLLIWNLVSGFTRRPYYVYNYHNNPEKIPEEIPLPANLIVMCPDNVTSLCAPNTAPLCTTNSTILCVALAQQTVPCSDNSTLKCVSSEVTCNEGEDNCKETASKNQTSAVNVPCVTNATVLGKASGSALPFAGTGDTTNLCVTTLAVPQPEDDIKAAEAAGCGGSTDQAQNSTCTANVTTPASNVTLTNLNATYPLAM